MKFYTNIYGHGNNILERYIEDGERKMRKVPYEPTLYVNSTKQTAFKTIHGKQVEPRNFESIREARNFIQSHGKVSNSPIYGMQQFAYAYINIPKLDTISEIFISIELKNETDKHPGETVKKLNIIHKPNTVCVPL